MKKYIITAIFLLFCAINATFAGGWGFELPTLKLKENNSAFYPKRYLFGTSTFIGDSTSYVTLNKGLYIYDSLRVQRDLYVGGTGGTIYLDTSRIGKIYFNGYSLYLENGKAGYTYFYCGDTTFSGFSFNKFKTGTGQTVELGSLDSTNGLTVAIGNIQFTGGTQQYKYSKDTVSDYDSNDSCTLNKQAVVITTKSENTAAAGFCDVYWVNSLITATSIVTWSFYNITNSQGLPLQYEAVPSAGLVRFRIYNAHASQAFNGTFKISAVVIN